MRRIKLRSERSRADEKWMSGVIWMNAICESHYHFMPGFLNADLFCVAFLSATMTPRISRLVNTGMEMILGSWISIYTIYLTLDNGTVVEYCCLRDIISLVVQSDIDRVEYSVQRL